MKNMIRSAVAFAAVSAGSAFAALPTEATAAINDGMADAATLGGLVLGVVTAIAAFKWIRRAL